MCVGITGPPFEFRGLLKTRKGVIKFFGCLETTIRYDTSRPLSCSVDDVSVQVTEVGTMNIFVHWINEDGG